MRNIITFQQALRDSESLGKRHLLLGNGFSIACKPDIFYYGTLFERADFSAIPEALSVFAVSETQDFEVAIRTLDNGSKLLPIYASESASAAVTMQQQASGLKELSISTAAHSGNIHYLHGALHLFDSGSELLKYTMVYTVWRWWQ